VTTWRPTVARPTSRALVVEGIVYVILAPQKIGSSRSPLLLMSGGGLSHRLSNTGGPGLNSTRLSRSYAEPPRACRGGDR
jgi:hypothetical protein